MIRLSPRGRRFQALFTCLVLIVPLVRAQQPAPPNQAPTPQPIQLPPHPLKIFVLEGQGAFNIIPDRRAVSPVVEIRDENDQPVEGADVRFALSGTGPGGLFDNGQPVKIVKTNVQGQATALLIPNDQEGRFDIAVTATAGNRTIRAVISQTNVMVQPVVKAHKPLYKNWKLWVVVGSGAAATAIILATRGGSSGTPTVVNVGTPVFGPP